MCNPDKSKPLAGQGRRLALEKNPFREGLTVKIRRDTERSIAKKVGSCRGITGELPLG